MLKVIITIFIKAISLIYAVFKTRESKDKVSFLSRQSNSASVDFQLLVNSLEERGIETYVSCRKVTYSPSYLFVLLKDLFNIANSKVVVLDGYSLAVSNFVHKEDLKVFQIWHSMGTMKKFGKQILGEKDGRSKSIAYSFNMHKQYDYIIASSKEYAKDLAEGFGYDSSYVHIYSLPRVDLLKDKDYENGLRERIYKSHPLLKDKENIIFAPTFRSDISMLNNIKDIISVIDFEKYNLILSLHPLDNKGRSQIRDLVKGNEGVVYDEQYTTFEFLFVSKKLISDYSCIIYDAMVRDIVVYFYVPDIERYIEDRGLLIDIEKEYQGYVFRNITELKTGINIGVEKEDILFYSKKREKYIENIENTKEKLVEFILEKGGLK